MSPRTHALGAAVVALGAATAGLGALVATAPPAAAATCSGGGVSVVVDFKGLGGGQQTGCVTGKGGSSAAAVFSAAGVDLTRARNQPGFVCRVQQVPADDPCVNASSAEAYWSLWWSDGSSGSWSYASLGVDQLDIPEGGSVAFAWDDQPGQVKPGTAPPKQAAPAPAPSPGQGGSGGAGGGGATSPTPAAGQTGPTTAPTAATSTAGPAQGDPTAEPDPQRAKDRKAARKAEREAEREAEDVDETTGADADDAGDPGDPDDAGEAGDVVDLEDVEPTAAPGSDPDGLPTWVAPLVLGLLGLALAGVAVVRRRRGA